MMIKLTRTGGGGIVVNADEIEILDVSKDTALTTKSGRVILVKENADEIIEKVVEYKRACLSLYSEKINKL